MATGKSTLMGERSYDPLQTRSSRSWSLFAFWRAWANLANAHAGVQPVFPSSPAAVTKSTLQPSDGVGVVQSPMTGGEPDAPPAPAPEAPPVPPPETPPVPPATLPPSPA